MKTIKFCVYVYALTFENHGKHGKLCKRINMNVEKFKT